MIPPILRPADRRCNRFRLRRRLGAAALGLLIAAPSTVADIQQGKSGGRDDKEKDKPARQDNIRRAAEIPTPQDAGVTVLRGVPTRIVLAATASLRQPVIFRLGDRPAHGTLSDPRPSSESNSKAVVTYTAGPGTASADAFTFRVKHRDTATSGSAAVRIRIVDPVPDLHVQPELDFGEAVVGESAVRPLVLENRGTAAFSAPLRLDPPWRLQQETPLVWVEAGAKVELRIAFAPLSPGEATARLEFPGVEGTVTRLIGRGLSPVRLQPSLVQMSWDAEARSRRAVATLANRLETPVDYTVASSPRLVFSAERGTLPPRGSAEIAVALPLPDTGDFQSLLAVVANGVREEVPVTAPPAPAVLAVREAEGWEGEPPNFRLPAGVEEGALVIVNEGGESAALVVSLPTGWSSPGLENAAPLGPRESRRLLLVPPSDRADDVSGELDLRLDEDRLALALAAPALPQTPASASPIAPDTLLTAAPSVMTADSRRELTAEERQLQFMIDTLGIFPYETRFDRSLPELQAVTVGKMEPDRVLLSLKSVGADYSYVIFRDEYRPPPGGVRPTRHWLPIEGLKWKSAGETVATTLGGLMPGERILLRFAVRTADGRVGPPSNPIIITTPAPEPRRWGWIAFGAIALGAGWWWRRRLRSGN